MLQRLLSVTVAESFRLHAWIVELRRRSFCFCVPRRRRRGGGCCGRCGAARTTSAAGGGCCRGTAPRKGESRPAVKPSSHQGIRSATTGTDQSVTAVAPALWMAAAHLHEGRQLLRPAADAVVVWQGAACGARGQSAVRRAPKKSSEVYRAARACEAPQPTASRLAFRAAPAVRVMLSAVRPRLFSSGDSRASVCSRAAHPSSRGAPRGSGPRRRRIAGLGRRRRAPRGCPCIASAAPAGALPPTCAPPPG